MAELKVAEDTSKAVSGGQVGARGAVDGPLGAKAATRARAGDKSEPVNRVLDPKSQKIMAALEIKKRIDS